MHFISFFSGLFTLYQDFGIGLLRIHVSTLMDFDTICILADCPRQARSLYFGHPNPSEFIRSTLINPNYPDRTGLSSSFP